MAVSSVSAPTTAFLSNQLDAIDGDSDGFIERRSIGKTLFRAMDTDHSRQVTTREASAFFAAHVGPSRVAALSAAADSQLRTEELLSHLEVREGTASNIAAAVLGFGVFWIGGPVLVLSGVCALLPALGIGLLAGGLVALLIYLLAHTVFASSEIKEARVQNDRANTSFERQVEITERAAANVSLVRGLTPPARA